jgi:hypothetical protein
MYLGTLVNTILFMFMFKNVAVHIHLNVDTNPPHIHNEGMVGYNATTSLRRQWSNHRPCLASSERVARPGPVDQLQQRVPKCPTKEELRALVLAQVGLGAVAVPDRPVVPAHPPSHNSTAIIRIHT